MTTPHEEQELREELESAFRVGLKMRIEIRSLRSSLAAHQEVIEKKNKALSTALSEINGKEFVAACVDDGISPELHRLWNLRSQIRAALALTPESMKEKT